MKLQSELDALSHKLKEEQGSKKQITLILLEDRKKMATLISSIKQDNKNCNSSQFLVNYKPEEVVKQPSLASLAREITKTKDKSTTPARSRDSGFRFKRKADNQTKLDDFFSRVAPDPVPSTSKDAGSDDDLAAADALDTEEGHCASPPEALDNHVKKKSTEQELFEKEEEEEMEDASDCKPVAVVKESDEAASISTVQSVVEHDPDVECIKESTKFDNVGSETVSKIEDKIAKLTKDMREGNDQIAYIQSIKLREKREGQQHLADASKKPASPEPSDGHKPLQIQPRKTASRDDKKKMKTKVADGMIDELVPFKQSGAIPSKAIFKVLARELTHLVLKSDPALQKINIKSLVKKFFQNCQVIQSEAEALSRVKKFKIKI